MEDQTTTEENVQEDEVIDSESSTESGEESTAEDTTDGNEGEESSESGSKGVQRRINDLTAKFREAEREAEYWKSKAVPPEVSKKPVASDFEDYEDYIDALTDYKAEQMQDQILQKVTAKVKQESIPDQINAYHSNGSEKYDDFSDVVSVATITETMRDVLLATEKGVDVGYYLGKHVGESRKIANLPKHLQAAELGKIEERLKTKKQTQKKPVKPLKTIKGGGTVTNPDLDDDDLSYEEYERRRLQGA